MGVGNYRRRPRLCHGATTKAGVRPGVGGPSGETAWWYAGGDGRRGRRLRGAVWGTVQRTLTSPPGDTPRRLEPAEAALNVASPGIPVRGAQPLGLRRRPVVIAG